MRSYQVVTFGRPLAEVLRDDPRPQAAEVLLRIGSCGVCHSDAHLHDGFFDLGGGNKLDMTRSVRPPRTLGHEIAGTVVAVGPDVRSVHVGDRRVVYPWIGCGECAFCVADREELCSAPRALGINRDGGFADHVLVPNERYLLDFGSLPEEQACTYACSGLTAFGALQKIAPAAANDPVLIIGAGGLGLAAIRLAKHMYGVAPIVAEVDRSKWPIAQAAGASECVDPSVATSARDLFKSVGGGVVAAIDFVGAAATFEFGFGVLRKGGKLVCVGLFGGATPMMPAMVPLKAATIVGSYVGSLADMSALMSIARSGVLPPLPVQSRPLDQAMLALDDLRAGRVHGRTILKP